MSSSVLILPGYGNSDEKHWQSLWQSKHPNFERVTQQSWDNPICDNWVNTLEVAVQQTKSGDLKIVAHSLGCLLLAKWAEQTKHKISGALLVAVPDPEGKNFPQQALGFNPVAKSQLNFPSTVIASSNDPYAQMAFAKNCADHWGSQFIELGEYGHINTESGLADWPFGYDQLMSL